MKTFTLFVLLFLPLTILASTVKAERKSPGLTYKKLPQIRTTQTIRVKDGEQISIDAQKIRQKINGKWVERLAYNGMIPGPTILATQGSSITLKLINHIGQPTTLHSHGLRVDDRNDGVPGIGQPPIKNGESFTYQLKFPDHGLYWYHPHMREDLTQELGLYGAFLVAPKAPDANVPKREEVLVLDDILTTPDGIPSLDLKHTSFALMGRYGNQLLINNSVRPDFNVKRGEVVRFYLVNAANARPFRIGFSGTKMKVVGADNGFFEHEFYAETVILAPSERTIVDVLFDKAGVTEMQNHPNNDLISMGRFIVKDNSKNPHETDRKHFSTLFDHPEVSSEFKTLSGLVTSEPNYEIKIDAQLTGAHATHMATAETSKDGIEWNDTMGAMSEDMTEENVLWKITDVRTGKVNMDIDWKFKQNIPVKIRIRNDGTHHPMQHPIHFHGQRFLVVNHNGQLNKNLAWKDTVLVPAGQYVDLILDNQNPGHWMGHCHIAEHLNVGMMFGFSVEPKGGT